MDRALALACDRALFGLTPEKEMELVALLPPGARIDPGLDLAAAAIALSELTIDEPLPAHLAELAFAASDRDRRAPDVARGGTVPISIREPAAATMLLPGAGGPVEAGPHPANPGPSNVVSLVLPAGSPLPDPAVPRNTEVHGQTSGFVPAVLGAAHPKQSVLPWLAAAACLAIAIGSYAYFGTRKGAPPPVASNRDPREKPSAAEARERLVKEAKDVVRTAWGETGDAAGKGESGEVVWSNERQEGYMTFRAVATNDPKTTQYQLWIFDAERDDRYPVDGGVFDVDTSKGEVTIPISAKVAVGKPTLFAVTVERPGGVVVSKRERIVVTAKPA